MICKHCNKRIWFWQDKTKKIEPIDPGEYILRHRVVYYHAGCWLTRYNDVLKQIDIDMHDGQLCKTHKYRAATMNEMRIRAIYDRQRKFVTDGVERINNTRH